MKTLLVLVVGIVIGAFGLQWYQQRAAVSRTGSPADASSSARDAADRAVARTRAAAADMADALEAKMQAWHLTPDEIRADLARSGQVVRENSARLRDQVSDARIVAVIKAKYVLEKDFPVSAVRVDSSDGRVTLSGSLASEPLVARAVALALDTDGVRDVTSRIKVAATP